MVLAPEPPRQNATAGEQRWGPGAGGAGFSVGGRRPSRSAFKASGRAGPGAESGAGAGVAAGPEQGPGAEDRRLDSAAGPRLLRSGEVSAGGAGWGGLRRGGGVHV